MPATEVSPIYHLAPRSELAQQIAGASYVPPGFAEDGFVHCTGDLETLTLVAQAYFSELDEDLLGLAIDVAKLSSPLRWEPAAAPRGVGNEYPSEARQFPHVYGPINLSAVAGVALVPMVDGLFRAPVAFESLETVRGAMPEMER